MNSHNHLFRVTCYLYGILDRDNQLPSSYCLLLHRFFTIENTQIPANDPDLPSYLAITDEFTCSYVLFLDLVIHPYKFKTCTHNRHIKFFGAVAGDLFVFLFLLNLCFNHSVVVFSFAFKKKTKKNTFHKVFSIHL